LYPSIYLGEQCIVFADTDIGSRMKCGATLANDDIARQDLFAGVTLDTEPLSLGIPTIARAATCFFMCHKKFSLYY
jgi:hypothetical protein